MKLVGDVEADRLGEAGRFREARVDVPAPPPRLHIGKGDDHPGAAGELAVVLLAGGAQAAGSSSSCSMKLTGRSGCTVEMACL